VTEAKSKYTPPPTSLKTTSTPPGAGPPKPHLKPSAFAQDFWTRPTAGARFLTALHFPAEPSGRGMRQHTNAQLTMET
jgi:hypothetical protein